MFDSSNYYYNPNNFVQHVLNEETPSRFVDPRSSNGALTPLDDNTRFNFSPQRSQMISRKTALSTDNFNNQNIHNSQNINFDPSPPYYDNHMSNINYNPYFNGYSIFAQSSMYNNNNGLQTMSQQSISNNSNQNLYNIGSNGNQSNNVGIKQNYKQKSYTNNFNNDSYQIEDIQNHNEPNKMQNKFKPNKKNPVLPPKKENKLSQNKIHNHSNNSNVNNNGMSTKEPKPKKLYSNRNTANYNSNYIVKQSTNHANENDDNSSLSMSPITVLTTISGHSNNDNEDHNNRSSNCDCHADNCESENNDCPKILSSQNSNREKHICEQWSNIGICAQGDKCPFSHATIINDSRIHVTNYKTKPCVDPGRGFECQYYQKCNFAHPGEPLRRPMPIEHDDKQYYAYLLRDCPTNQYPFGIFV